jgi:hypothetical protein
LYRKRSPRIVNQTVPKIITILPLFLFVVVEVEPFHIFNVVIKPTELQDTDETGKSLYFGAIPYTFMLSIF